MSNIIATFANKLKKSNCKAFYKDEGGNFAIIFALTTLPVLMSVGLGIDYSRSADARAAMQAAADSAVIALVLDNTSDTCVVKKQRAINSVKGSMKSKDWINYTDAGIVVTDDATGGCTVAISGQINTAVMAIAGFKTMDVAVTSTAISAPAKKIEIALALDNTASMGDQGMIDLRKAANNFVDTMSTKTPSTHLKIGIVPFVAMVNPGKDYIDNPEMADYEGDADYHGYYFSGVLIDGSIDCDSGSFTGTGSGGNHGENGASLQLDNLNSNFKFSSIFQELIGVKSAHAGAKRGGTTTPTDWPTIKSTWKPRPFIIPKTGNTGYITTPLTATPYDFTFPAPTGTFGVNSTCLFYNPLKINHFDLFSRTGPSGVPWKGCVMARKAPYDVNDSEPTTDANTKFVPVFWPSEPPSDKNMAYNGTYGDPKGYSDAQLNNLKLPTYRNTYLAPTFWHGPEHPIPYDSLRNVYLNLGLLGGDYFFSSADILKYNNSLNDMASINIIEDAVDTLGPNKGCPNEVTPLTNSTSKVKSEIDKLTRWNGGGTVTSEGLMWAWRVLSPKAPYGSNVPRVKGTGFFGGAEYSDTTTQKYIILMSDGANYLNETGPKNVTTVYNGVTYPAIPPIATEQTAYGAIYPYHEDDIKSFAPQVLGAVTGNTAGINTKAAADTLLDERFALACTNAKAQGIKVYTIYFSHGSTDPDAVRAEKILSDCSGANHINATDSNALDAAFKKIAASIYSSPRLSK
jgi:Flp pilus assembly protein TadG